MSDRFKRSGPYMGARTAAFLIVVTLQLGIFTHAQSYSWKNVVTNGGGGFISGIVFNQGQPNVVYVRTDIGGAYRLDPATKRWVPLMDWIGFDDWNTMGVESIATDPVDPQRVYVAAGTYTNSFTTSNGAILRSTDQGNTWQRTDLPFKLGGNMPARSMGERLAIDPNNHSILYLGTRSGNGLWKSTDFGATWSKVTSFPQPGTYVIVPGDIYQGDIVGVAWIAFDPRSATAGNTTQTIYVGVAQPFGTNIYRSTDGGATWSALPGQLTCSLSGSNVSCTNGASWTIGNTSPSHPGSGFLPQHGKLSPNGMLYITYSDGAGPFDGSIGDVWKYNTATGAWSQIAPVLPTAPNGDDYFGYGGLAIDAQNPNTIMVSALNSWWPDTIIFRSTDAGATWTRIWDWTSFPSRSFRYVQDISAAPWLNFGDTNPVPPVPSPKLGWMVASLEIDPFNSGRMFYGTGATLYGTNDLTNWDTGAQIHISVAAQGIEEAATLGLISPPTGAHLYSALGDIGGFRHDDLITSPAAMYSVPFAGTNVSIDYAELSPSFITRVGNGDDTKSPPVRSTAFTFDSGSNWFQGNSDPPGYTNGGGGTIAAAANASRVLWDPQGLGAFFSTDNGNSWTASTGLPAGGRVASDRVNPSKFYAFVNPTFYVSTNGGASFTASAATGLPAAGAPVRFKAVPGHEGDIWLAGGATGATYGLWHSTDSGASFTKLANVDKADTIGFGMAAPGQSYPALYTSAQIGGVRGIFRSDDAGTTWVRINDNQHQYGSTNDAITGDPRVYGRVFFSTNGRGIIVGDISGTPTPDITLSATPTALTVNQGDSTTTTITVARLNGFANTVSFTASGMPTGVTASFSPASTTTTGTSTVLTLAASATAPIGTATITITGTGGGVTRTATVVLTVSTVPMPDFSLSANPTSLSVAAGGSGTTTITITRVNGFTSPITLAVGGLPSGVTGSCTPNPVTASSCTLTIAVASTAAAGPATLTLTAAGGGRTHVLSLGLTITGAPDFSISPPNNIVVPAGGCGTSTIVLTRSGLTASVAFTLSALPTGATATFNPASITGTSTVLTVCVASTTPVGTYPLTITATSGTLAHTTTLTLTVTGGGGNGGVTVTPVVAANSSFFNEEQVQIANTSTLTTLTVTIVVQRTTGVSFSGQYNTVGGQIAQTNASTASTITYTYTLGSGTLGPLTNRTLAAQFSGSGTLHPTAGDTYSVTYTTDGATFTQTGHF